MKPSLAPPVLVAQMYWFFAAHWLAGRHKRYLLITPHKGFLGSTSHSISSATTVLGLSSR